MDSDSDHATIERKLSKEDIHSPNDYDTGRIIKWPQEKLVNNTKFIMQNSNF